MKIKQVEELVGISSKNIRFYEDQGLLTPNRADNGYREYHEPEIARLKQIKFLRKLGVPISQIQELLSHSLSLDSCLQTASDTAAPEFERSERRAFAKT